MEILSLGLTQYEQVWDLQRERQRALIDGAQPEVLILCQHHPVITYGKSNKKQHLLVSEETVTQKGITLFEVERGGDITYHGPGQLIAYPIVDLRLRKRDVGWYMRLLEEAVIKTLQTFEIVGQRIKGKTGVWVLQDQLAAHKKIAAQGVKMSRWCTLHGLSLNVQDQPGMMTLQEGFSLITPCGLEGIQVTSMEEILGKRVQIQEVEKVLTDSLIKLL